MPKKFTHFVPPVCESVGNGYDDVPVTGGGEGEDHQDFVRALRGRQGTRRERRENRQQKQMAPHSVNYDKKLRYISSKLALKRGILLVIYIFWGVD